MRISLVKIICLFVLSTCLEVNASTPWLLSLDAAYLQESLDFGAVSYSFEKDTNFSEKEVVMVEHVKKSIAHAWLGISQILESIQRKTDGMSTSRVKHLLSNICSLAHTRYLEIGVGKGSTFIAALHNNQATIDYAVGIDNWSEAARADFEKNCSSLIPKQRYSYTLLSQDCFVINPKKSILHPVNVCFYSGNCSSAGKAFTHYDAILDNVFIVVIDNWSEESTRNSTLAAFDALHYEILFEMDLPAHKKALWWNGIYIAVVRKASLR